MVIQCVSTVSKRFLLKSFTIVLQVAQSVSKHHSSRKKFYQIKAKLIIYKIDISKTNQIKEGKFCKNTLIFKIKINFSFLFISKIFFVSKMKSKRDTNNKKSNQWYLPIKTRTFYFLNISNILGFFFVKMIDFLIKRVLQKQSDYQILCPTNRSNDFLEILLLCSLQRKILSIQLLPFFFHLKQMK